MPDPALLVVLPVHSGDVDLCLKNIELVQRFDGQLPFDCIVHHPHTFEPSGILPEIRKAFRAVRVNRYNDWTGPKTWPQPANWAWQEAARAVSALNRPWFWWEQDAVPLRPLWLQTIWEAYKAGGKPFGGHIVTHAQLGPYMNGVGIYPPNISHYCQQAMRVVKHPFDIVAGRIDRNVAAVADLSQLFGLDPLHRAVSFYDKSELDALLAAGNVIYHHCKDGSLYLHLTGRPGPVRVADDAQPSFLEQHPRWPSGSFSFPPEANTVHFNPSLLHRDDTFYLFTRRHRFPNGPGHPPAHNDLTIWRLNRQLSPIDVTIPSTPRRWEREQWEDPRVVISQDSGVHVAFANWVHMRPWSIRQSLTRLSANWQSFSVLHEPLYGGNAPVPERATHHEKNWLWFQQDGAWHIVYLHNPMTVLRLRPNGNVEKVWKNKQLPLPWTHGELRGGTTPVRVGGEYVTFFHSSMAWNRHQRRYFMGAATFQAEPPFSLLRVTPDPLLVGSEKDTRVYGGPLVIFPCGAVLNDAHWTVTFGVNDEASGWIRIPQGDLNKLLRPLDPARPSLMSRLADAVLP
jgi:predicted GH43/DUF377 family glycosyl hydrolase